MREKKRIVHTEENPFDNSVTVFFNDDTALKFARDRMHTDPMGALAETMSRIGVDSEPVDVIQYGKKVGELPSFWHPAIAKSKSFLYDYRKGDLRMEDGKWIAHQSLGGGDLDCLIGFVRKDA